MLVYSNKAVELEQARQNPSECRGSVMASSSGFLPVEANMVTRQTATCWRPCISTSMKDAGMDPAQMRVRAACKCKYSLHSACKGL